MKTSYRGTFVISWLQTQVDGVAGAPTATLEAGSNWRWSGAVQRVDGPPDVLLLQLSDRVTSTGEVAASKIHNPTGTPVPEVRMQGLDDGALPLPDVGFEVTDGWRSYRVTMITASTSTPPLLIFQGDIPPIETDLWVVRAQMQASGLRRVVDQPSGVICFTPGTRIRTVHGEKLVEDLGQGDRVQTKDNGSQEILWVGQRRITGARIHATPELRPVRFRADALGEGQPDSDLVVSPQHRMLIKGDKARALFNTDEVLVAAEDLIDDHRVHLDHDLCELTYHHVLLNQHQIVWANGIETESFHPASTALEAVEARQRAQLFGTRPELEQDPKSYGDYARRNLTRYEAAILQDSAA